MSESFLYSNEARSDSEFEKNGEVLISKELKERRELVFEGHRKRLSDMLYGVLTSRTVDVVGNFIPGVDSFKMATEAYRKKTLSGEELSGRRCLDYALIAGGCALSNALMFAGMAAEGAALRGATISFSAFELGPDVLSGIAEKTKDKFPKASKMLVALSSPLEKLKDKEFYHSVMDSYGKAIGTYPIPM